RQEHVLRIPTGRYITLDVVDRCLRCGDAVMAEEKAFSPQKGLAADPHRDGHILQREGSIDERIADLRMLTVKIARGARELEIRHRGWVIGGGRVVVRSAVIDGVVPGG